jgi:single-stranded-DNA-specific exonuclease
LLENIHEGAELLSEIITHNGSILLVADCDMDGFTSAAIMYQYIKDIDATADIDYVLHSGKQHGLSDQINHIMNNEKHYDLVLLPDSSSNDYAYHEQLKEIGTRVLVLDHHLTDETISDNAVVINNQLSLDYPNKELTGAGVAYQFCRYFDKYYNCNHANKYIDLAAAGIVGDMGAVTDLENRYIIKRGLSQLNNKMLWALARKQAYSITGKMNASDRDIIEALNPISVAFYIVPLVNATIRVGTQQEKERLFLGFIDGDKLIPSNKRGARGELEKVAIESARECGNIRNRQNKLLDEAMFSMEIKISNNNLLDNKILFCRLEEEDDFPSELNGST